MRSVQNHYGIDFLCNPLGYSGENAYEDVNVVYGPVSLATHDLPKQKRAQTSALG